MFARYFSRTWVILSALRGTLLELFQVQLPVDGDVLFGGEPAAAHAAAAVAVRVHAGGGRGGHGERLGAADGGGDRGRPGGAPQDRDGPHDRAAPQEGAHPGKKEIWGLNQFRTRHVKYGDASMKWL